MSNLSEVTRGGGHYGIEAWRNHVVSERLNSDWWIKSDRWDQLLADLRAVNFEVNSSRSEVASIINRVPKDLPAAVSARFPGAKGVLGSDTYTTLYYVHVKSDLKQKFYRLIAAADQGKNRDLEVGRSSVPAATSSSSNNQAIVPSKGINAIRDQQPLRDGSLSYRYDLLDIELTTVKQYDQFLFESTFSVNWIPNPAATPNAAAPGVN
ncbi:coat protein P23 [Indian peanut clump virus]|uniref:Coat protein n=1 Tax=Indian peanut clump virus TaxID=32629 RepID=Q82717_9VIRU|nr:coat protein P23 [Indian peanut clump virus]AAO15497.1 coat protein P23 [Indian peanut clump virus H]CAA54098.1 coat protein [Indian peanut clump virus]prf//2105167A coat protein [Indian peanut clump virus]